MLSIVIPAYNQADMTNECICSVLENTEGMEIVLIDNGSTPPIHPPFTGFIGMTLIRNEENKGFPVAVNQGIRAAKGDIIILLNNDVIVTPGWADILTGWLEDYDIVGPVTNYCAGMQKVQLTDYNNRAELDKEAGYLTEENEGQSEEVNWIIGFCMAFKKSLYDEIGAFDESLWPCSGEEIDFCFRARQAGYRIGIAQDVYVHHEGSLTFQDMEKAGSIKYEEVCKKSDENIAKKWGADFWRKQAVINIPVVAEGIRLNMGCGTFPMPGFINIDQFEDVKPDLVADCTKLPYAPGSVSEIYAGHILEHFKFADGMEALKYWHSLLCPGGVISISVPNFDYLANEYMEDPTPEKLIVFNDTYIYSGMQPSPHQYAYSAALLKKVMEEAGFVNLQRMPVDHPYFPYPVKWQCGFTGVKP